MGCQLTLPFAGDHQISSQVVSRRLVGMTAYLSLRRLDRYRRLTTRGLRRGSARYRLPTGRRNPALMSQASVLTSCGVPWTMSLVRPRS